MTYYSLLPALLFACLAYQLHLLSLQAFPKVLTFCWNFLNQISISLFSAFVHSHPVTAGLGCLPWMVILLSLSSSSLHCYNHHHCHHHQKRQNRKAFKRISSGHFLSSPSPRFYSAPWSTLSGAIGQHQGFSVILRLFFKQLFPGFNICLDHCGQQRGENKKEYLKEDTKNNSPSVKKQYSINRNRWVQ